MATNYEKYFGNMDRTATTLWNLKRNAEYLLDKGLDRCKCVKFTSGEPLQTTQDFWSWLQEECDD